MSFPDAVVTLCLISSPAALSKVVSEYETYGLNEARSTAPPLAYPILPPLAAAALTDCLLITKDPSGSVVLKLSPRPLPGTMNTPPPPARFKLFGLCPVRLNLASAVGPPYFLTVSGPEKTISPASNATGTPPSENL